MENVGLLWLKLAFKIPQKRYRGLASLMNYRQKTKGNANKAWDCTFTPSESQELPKLANILETGHIRSFRPRFGQVRLVMYQYNRLVLCSYDFGRKELGHMFLESQI